MLTETVLHNRKKLSPNGPLRYWPRALNRGLSFLIHTDQNAYDYKLAGDLPDMGPHGLGDSTLEGGAAWDAKINGGHAIDLEKATGDYIATPYTPSVNGGTVAVIVAVRSQATDDIFSDDGNFEAPPAGVNTIRMTSGGVGNVAAGVTDDTSTKTIVLGATVVDQWQLMVVQWEFGLGMRVALDGGDESAQTVLSAAPGTPDTAIDISRGINGYHAGMDFGMFAVWEGELLAHTVSKLLWGALGGTTE